MVNAYPGLYFDCPIDTAGGTGFLEGGRNSGVPGADKVRLLGGREPRELNKRTATSRSVEKQ